MRSVPAGSFQRLSEFASLWAAWESYRRGKRRCTAVAAFDIDADLNVLALHRDLSTGSYTPLPYRVSLVRRSQDALGRRPGAAGPRAAACPG